MKKFILFVCAVSSVALFAATPEFNLAFNNVTDTVPEGWVINPSMKDGDKISGHAKIEKGDTGNVLVFTSEKNYAALYTEPMTPAKAGQTFNASASVSGKGNRFVILFYSYDEKGENVSVPQVEYLKLTDTPIVQKFSIPITNSDSKVVTKVRVAIIIQPETELKLSNLKISVD